MSRSLGHSIDGKWIPEYAAYHNAKNRCRNPNVGQNTWGDYGGRGIEFRFSSFDQFIAEVGYKPTPKHTLDRIESDGHYEPGNLRWATRKQQAANRRVTPERIAHIKKWLRIGYQAAASKRDPVNGRFLKH